MYMYMDGYRKSTCSKAYWFMASVYFIYCILIELTNIPYSHKNLAPSIVFNFILKLIRIHVL